MIKLCLLFASAFIATASAQLISIGALGGVRLTDSFDNNDESRRYVVGGSVEVHLIAGFAIEADALYQRVGDTTRFLDFVPAQLYINRDRGNSWEFPLYGKYYFRSPDAAWRPFIGTGYAFRTISVHEDSTILGGDPLTSNFHSDFRSNLGIGASMEAGVRFHYGKLAILPQVRYTRWGGSDQGLNKNEAKLLLGVSF
jgi:hypothetical protein